MPPPLRLLIVRQEHDPLPDWQAMLLDRLESDPQFELVGTIEGQGPISQFQRGFLLRSFLALERLAVRSNLLPYDKEGAVKLLADLPVLSETQAPQIADVALEFGARGLEPTQMNVTAKGIWSLTYGGATDVSHVAADAIQQKAPGLMVQILSRSVDSPNLSVVRDAQYNLKPSAILTSAYIAEKSVLLVERCLRDLATGERAAPSTTAPIAAPKPPKFNTEVGYVACFVQTAATKLLEGWRARRGRATEYWRLAKGSGDVLDIESRTATALPALQHTMADPFLFEDGGKTWVFYEAMNADDGAGWIAVSALNGDTLEAPATALKCPYHLSFPFVFRDGDNIYMLPETQQSRRLEVWRAVDFPTKWERHATAFEDQCLADSSLWKAQDGQWWLLTNLSDHHAFQDHSSELYLFAIDGPDLKTISPHPANPVTIGADHARNAGAIIQQHGRLYRPSQNNSYHYGYGLNLMEITQLDATTYAETMVRSWTPDDRPGSTGIHHLSTAGGQFVIDWSGK